MDTRYIIDILCISTFFFYKKKKRNLTSFKLFITFHLKLELMWVFLLYHKKFHFQEIKFEGKKIHTKTYNLISSWNRCRHYHLDGTWGNLKYSFVGIVRVDIDTLWYIYTQIIFLIKFYQSKKKKKNLISKFLLNK